MFGAQLPFGSYASLLLLITSPSGGGVGGPRARSLFPPDLNRGLAIKGLSECFFKQMEGMGGWLIDVGMDG